MIRDEEWNRMEIKGQEKAHTVVMALVIMSL